ncbi:MAG TPA: IPT/TIG domain-containing protein, partial [Myxococcota bacterium]|nr:IPT/TIG domain-containing protein [Myxococcota bacterium]
MHEPRAHDPMSGLPAEPRLPRGLSRVLLLSALLAPLGIGCGDELAPVGDTGDTTSETSPDTPDTTVEPDVDPQLTLVVTSVTPSEGRTSGLEEVTLTGRGLSKVVQVRIGDAAAVDPFPVSDTLLVALTPPNDRGLYDVTVVDDLGKSYTLPMAYKYVEPVQVISAEPAVGTALGGERVVVYGAGFGRDAVVLIGGRRAVSTRFIDTNTLEVVTPEGTPGKVDVHVSGTGGSGRLRRGFEYLDAGLPTAAFRVTSVSPASGPVEGGTRVTLEGSGFG